MPQKTPCLRRRAAGRPPEGRKQGREHGHRTHLKKAGVFQFPLNQDKKAMGYPDIMFYYKDTPNYLECKTYNQSNVEATQRSFYFFTSDDFKVIYDTHRFIISYEMYVAGREGNKNIYKCRYWKILSLDSLSLDVKCEFNSDNKRLYSGEDGTVLLAEGEV